jgi:hypothetical protein
VRVAKQEDASKLSQHVKGAAQQGKGCVSLIGYRTNR